MDTNSKLKIALIKRGQTKKQLADSLGITSSYLAHLIKWMNFEDESLIPDSPKAKQATKKIKELIGSEDSKVFAQN